MSSVMGGIIVISISLIYLLSYAYTHTFVVWTIGYLLTLVLGIGLVVAGVKGK